MLAGFSTPISLWRVGSWFTNAAVQPLAWTLSMRSSILLRLASWYAPTRVASTGTSATPNRIATRRLNDRGMVQTPFRSTEVDAGVGREARGPAPTPCERRRGCGRGIDNGLTGPRSEDRAL